MRELYRFLRIFFRLLGTFYVMTPEKKSTGATKKTSRLEPPATTTTNVSEPAPVSISNTAVSTLAASNTSTLLFGQSQLNTVVPTTTVINVQSTIPTSISTGPNSLVTQPTEVFSPTQFPDPLDSRVSWIYDMNKDQLKREMGKYGLPNEGRVEELRKRFSKFWKASAGYFKPLEATLSPMSSSFHETPVSRRIQETTEEMESVREILGLSPNADGNTLRRTLTTLVRTSQASTSEPVRETAPELTRVTFSHQFYGHCTAAQTNATPYPPLSGPPIERSTVLDLPSPPRARHYGPQTGSEPSRHDLASVCNAVRKWGLRFDGKRNPVSFLERLHELMETYSFSPDEVLKAMPELLQGTALLWYRNSKELWASFTEFQRHFELQFLPPGYYRALDDEIKKRTQGEREPFRDYVVAITTLIRRRGIHSGHQKLEQIYSNMRPDYKMMVRRQDFGTLTQLIERAEEYEAFVREKNAFRPPPPPNMSLVEETAYHPRKRFDRNLDTSQVERRHPNPSPMTVRTQEPRREFLRARQTASSTPPPNMEKDSSELRVKLPELTSSPPVRSSDRPQHVQPSVQPSFICWNCDQAGHRYRDCSQPKVLRCYYCKTVGVPTTRCQCRSGNDLRDQEERGHLAYPDNEHARPQPSGTSGSKK